MSDMSMTRDNSESPAGEGSAGRGRCRRFSFASFRDVAACVFDRLIATPLEPLLIAHCGAVNAVNNATMLDRSKTGRRPVVGARALLSRFGGSIDLADFSRRS